jgi:phage regulator Rha-like protein
MGRQLEIDVPKFGRIYKDSMNRNQCEFLLNRDLTDCLLTGYNAKLRMKVITRWKELEKQVAQPKLPQSFAEALRLAADTQEQLEAESQQRQIAELDVSNRAYLLDTHSSSPPARISSCPVELIN